MSALYKHIIALIIILFFQQVEINAINQATEENTTVNYTDKDGLKQGTWEFYYKDSALKEKGIYKDNLKQGIWICYFESGKKESEITYVDGEAKGHATFYYKNGKIREKGNWQIDHWEDNYQYYHENGQISYNWNYNKEGKREGEQLYFHENGEKMYSGNWSNGKTEGKLQVFNEQGVLVEEKTYANGKISKTIPIEPLDMALKNQSNKPRNEDIPRLKFEGTGNHTIISTNGRITAKGFFVKGILFNGEKFNYDETEQLISITYYRNGKKEETKLKKN